MTGADLAIHAAQIARALLGEENAEHSTQAELRWGTNGSLAVRIASPRRGTWFDHEAGTGGGLLDLIRREKGFSNGQAFDWLRSIGIEAAEPGRANGAEPRRVMATYVYRDRRGEPVYRVLRWAPKSFSQQRWDPEKAEFVGGAGAMNDVQRVPYRLPELLASEGAVLITEGEKDCDRLAELGFVATCNPGGAGKWGKGFGPLYFTGVDAVVIPDNDDAGRRHAREVVENIAPVVARVRILELPGLAPKGDASDWLDAGHPIEELRELIDGAPDAADVLATWTGTAEPDATDQDEYAATVARLAALSPADYDRRRKDEAKRLGVRTVTLDADVEKARPEPEPDEADSGKGQPLGLLDPEPWPEPVDGEQLIGDVVAAIHRYLILPERSALATALWTVHAHTLDFATVAPRLLITAPTRECGKTVLLDAVSRLVPRPLPAANISPAGIFRTTEVARPTLLIDEADTFLKDSDELRGVINSGHTRSSAFVIRVGEIGGEYEPRKYSTWSAMAISGIGTMPGTITSRSIVVKMERKLPAERVARLTHRTGHDLDVLCRKIARWTADHRAKLETAAPDVPEQLGNRAADNWIELLAIADTAGGDWPQKAREVALARAAEDDGEIKSIQLLGDIKEVIGVDKAFTDDLLARLNAIAERPWATFSKGKPMTAHQLARLLRQFGIKSKSIRAGDRTGKGFERSDFDDAWNRYLPPEGDSDPSHRHNQGNPRPPEDSYPSHAACSVTDGNGWKAAEILNCDGVTDCEGVDEPWRDDPAESCNWNRDEPDCCHCGAPILVHEDRIGRDDGRLIHRRCFAAGFRSRAS